MDRKLRTCSCCLTKYQYCPNCNADKNKPTWMFAFCSENCKNIYTVTMQYENKEINANEAKKQLDKLDLSKLNNFGTSYKNSINKIISETTSTAQSDENSGENIKTEESVETVEESEKEEKVLKKPRNKRAKIDVEE